MSNNVSRCCCGSSSSFRLGVGSLWWRTVSTDAPPHYPLGGHLYGSLVSLRQPVHNTETWRRRSSVPERRKFYRSTGRARRQTAGLRERPPGTSPCASSCSAWRAPGRPPWFRCVTARDEANANANMCPLKGCDVR